MVVKIELGRSISVTVVVGRSAEGRMVVSGKNSRYLNSILPGAHGSPVGWKASIRSNTLTARTAALLSNLESQDARFPVAPVSPLT